MDEVERKDVAVTNAAAETSPPLSKVRAAGVDTRSREAFELLKLGEAICNLQVDQRRMRLDAEDMRFERDRYKASAAEFQDKLFTAFNENARLRDLRNVLETLSTQLEADAGVERTRLTAALQDSDARLNASRLDNEQISNELNALRLENKRISIELHNSRIQAESARQAYVNLIQGLIAEVQAQGEQATVPLR